MRKTMVKAFLAAGGIIVGLAAAPKAQAQAPAHKEQVSGGHSHTAPHGGEVLEVADHHVEFKADSLGAIQVWLLDAKQRVIAAPTGATVTLMGGSDKQVTLLLQADPTSQRLVARFDTRKFTSFLAVVSLSIDGKRHNLRFRYPSHH